MGMNKVSHQIPSRSNHEITVYEYTSDMIKGTVIFPPAMAVRQHFYRHLAEHLANEGYQTYTMDYSGIGESRNEPIKGSDITIEDWILEVEDVISWIEERDNPDYFYYITHSLGGQFFGLLEDTSMIDATVMITSQNGYWKFYKNKYSYFFFWYFLTPLSYHLLGYFPGSKLGLGVDLPKNVMRQWKRWCTSKNYFFDDETMDRIKNYDNYSGPILTLSFDDDPWATEDAVNDLVHHYSNADINHQHITPAEKGLDNIGHFGYFKEQSRDLWQEMITWLHEKTYQI